MLRKSANIEMRSEDLFISTEKVHVQYRFFNRSPQPVTTVVAFPMPNQSTENPDEDDMATAGSEGLRAFRTRVDGKPVEMALEQKVTARGADHTKLLRDLNVPLSPSAADDALKRLSPEEIEGLIHLGLVERHIYDNGGRTEQQLSARWTLETAYYWQQTFPPRQEIGIEHEYKPSVGNAVPRRIEGDYYRTRYCTDPEFLESAGRRPGLPQSWISYILTTGGNWAEPIGLFTLTIDKGSPDNLVSFCGHDVEKTGPTTFRMRKRDYTPTADLHVLILGHR